MSNHFLTHGYFDVMSIERHSRARQIELGRSLSHRKKVYLDARFWIIARDAFLGVREDAPALKLLSHLRHGVEDGQIICPISHSMFLELLKQPYTPERRIGTAELIDELSLGVTMIPSPVVNGTEIYAFLLKAKGDGDLHPMQELIWTKVANVLGEFYPSLAGISQSNELEIQKRFHDKMWSLKLTDMIKMIGDQAPFKGRFEDLSRETNTLNAAHKDELRSFEQTYDIELRGAIEVAGDVAADVICEFAQKEAERELTPTPEERATSVNMCRNLLYLAFKKPETKFALRLIHIGASLHAGMRWNKGRQFTPNDYYDFEHATAALSYCDAFLTEKPLQTLIRQPQLNLECINGCKVVSDIQVAAELIEQTLSP